MVMDRYIASFDELNKMLTASYMNAIESSESLERRAEMIRDDIVSYLILGYRMGVEDTAANLGVSASVDPDFLETALFLTIEGKTLFDRIWDDVVSGSMGALQAVVETEYHRMYNAGAYDTAAAYDYMDIIGTWSTMRDEKVRDTHDYLEGKQVALGERFYTYDGDSARYPGDFSKAENNVNCRCAVIWKLKSLGI